MTTLEELEKNNQYVRQHFSPEEILEMTCTEDAVANISPSLLEYARKRGHVWLIRTGRLTLLTPIPGGPSIPLYIEGDEPTEAKESVSTPQVPSLNTGKWPCRGCGKVPAVNGEGFCQACWDIVTSE